MPSNFEARHAREPVALGGGYVVDAAIVVRVLDLERRGARFVLLPQPGRFRVEPPDVLTDDDIAFLRAHRDDVRLVIEYGERSREPA